MCRGKEDTMGDSGLMKHRNLLIIKMYWIFLLVSISVFLFTENPTLAKIFAITAIPSMFLITYFVTRMMQLQSKLHESEKRFKAMVKQSSDGIFAFNPLTKAVVETNERFSEILGYDEDELLQLKISDFIVGDTVLIDQNINTIFQKQRFFIGEKLYRRKDKSMILVEVSGSVIHLHDNCFILANVRDITQRMEAEALIQKQGRLLKGVAEAMNGLLTNENHNIAIQKALEIIGRAVQVERVYIFETQFHKNQVMMSQRYDWVISEKFAALYDSDFYKQTNQNIGEGSWYRELSCGRSIHGPINTFPEYERTFLEKMRIKSLMIVPIFILDKLWGFIGFDDCHNERSWTKNEESILLAAAAGIGGAIKLNQDASLLLESETKYRLLSARLEALISHMHYGILAVDKDSQLILSNQRFKEIFNLPKSLNIYGLKHVDFLRWHQNLCIKDELIEARTKEIINERSKVLGEEWLLNDGRIFSRDAIPIFINNKYDGYLWLFNDITKQKEIEQKLTEASILDGLTNIYNRRYFDEKIQIEWKRCTRNFQPLSLIMLDIDCFKGFNDTYGHQSGDKCLKLVAKTIKETLRRPSDFVCRYGGEEFAVVLPNTHQDGGLQLAEKISKAIESLQIPHAASDVSNYVTCSIGVASLTSDPLSEAHELIHLADQALYQSKNSGRNCVSF